MSVPRFLPPPARCPLLLALALLVGTAGGTEGQELAPGPSAWRVSVGGMAGSGLPGEYFFPECSGGGSLGAFASVARTLTPWAAASVGLGYMRDIGIGGCAFSLLPPPEPYTEQEYVSEGPSVWAPMISVLLGPTLLDGALSVRAVGRAGLRDGLDRTGVLALGGEALMGPATGARVIFGFERWFTEVAEDRILRRVEDGEVVLEDRTREYSSGNFNAVRLGVSLPLGR